MNRTPQAGIGRRGFLKLAVGGSAGLWLSWTPSSLAGTGGTEWDPHRPFRVLGRPLRVQPVFMYALPVKKEQASWRSWGGVQTESEVTAETARITSELSRLKAGADFGLEVLPVIRSPRPRLRRGWRRETMI